jgi:hypothetical protein
MRQIFKYLSNITVNILIKLINLYQKTISPDHGWFKALHPYGYCRFYPTCSQYSLEALKKYGIIKGVSLSIWRIMRCNPWNKGGYDPLK